MAANRLPEDPQDASKLITEMWGADENGDLSNVHFIVDGSTWKHHAVFSVDEALTLAKRISDSKKDTYFALADFRETNNREEKNALGARGKWLDIDCDHDKAKSGKGYKDKPAARQALRTACLKLGISKPSIVESGNGLHVYWPFGQLVEKPNWQSMANRFKSELSKVGLLADPSRTADIASILRVPGTFNYKNRDEPKPVVIDCVGEWAKLEEFETVITSSELESADNDSIFEKARQVIDMIPGAWDRLGADYFRDIQRWHETEENIEDVENLLEAVSPAEFDVWMKVIWEVASQQWDCGIDLLIKWSQKSIEHWETPEEAEKAERRLRSIYKQYDRDKGKDIWALRIRAEKNGWKPDPPVAKQPTSTSTSDSTDNRYRFHTVDELNKLPPLEWHAKNLLPKQGLAAIYGPSGSGKSFLVLDILASISLGEDYYGYRVKPCPVIYVALEGAGGVSRRITAWERHHNMRLPDSFRVVTDTFSILSGDAKEFGEELIAADLSGGIIAIDTLNQSAPTADENSSQDMGAIISRAQKLAQATNSLVIFIHHTGKDISRGLRGHSSLHAALDAAIEVKNPMTGREWNISKLKDGEIGVAKPFRLDQIRLGTDSDGDKITSCIVAPDIFRANRPPEPTGSNQKLVLKALRDAYQTSTLIREADVIATGAEALDHKDKSRRRESCKNALSSLVKNGNLEQVEGGYELK